MSGAEGPSALPGELSVVPQHVAIIMDGNGRWALQRGLPRLAGHRAGTENVRRIIQSSVDYGIKVLTIFAFSTENWTRPQEEVRGLMSLLVQMLRRELENLRKNGVQLRHLGSTDDLPTDLQDGIRHAIQVTAANERLILNVALNYGGRREIVEAARRMLREGLLPDSVTEQTFGSYLDTSGLPDPDLVIRTSGEMRLSNFLVWQAVYAEFYSTPVYWPDFGPAQLLEALQDYGKRTRRYGGLAETAQ